MKNKLTDEQKEKLQAERDAYYNTPQGQLEKLKDEQFANEMKQHRKNMAFTGWLTTREYDEENEKPGRSPVW